MNSSQVQHLHDDGSQPDLDREISALVDHIRTLQRRIEAFTLEIQQSKQELQPLLQKLGRNWSDEDGYAKLVRQGVQRSYDVDALDRLILSDPLHYGWLVDYRRDRVITSHITVR